MTKCAALKTTAAPVSESQNSLPGGSLTPQFQLVGSSPQLGARAMGAPDG